MRQEGGRASPWRAPWPPGAPCRATPRVPARRIGSTARSSENGLTSAIHRLLHPEAHQPHEPHLFRPRGRCGATHTPIKSKRHVSFGSRRQTPKSQAPPSSDSLCATTRAISTLPSPSTVRASHPHSTHRLPTRSASGTSFRLPCQSHTLRPTTSLCCETTRALLIQKHGWFSDKLREFKWEGTTAGQIVGSQEAPVDDTCEEMDDEETLGPHPTTMLLGAMALPAAGGCRAMVLGRTEACEPLLETHIGPWECHRSRELRQQTPTGSLHLPRLLMRRLRNFRLQREASERLVADCAGSRGEELLFVCHAMPSCFLPETRALVCRKLGRGSAQAEADRAQSGREGTAALLGATAREGAAGRGRWRGAQRAQVKGTAYHPQGRRPLAPRAARASHRTCARARAPPAAAHLCDRNAGAQLALVRACVGRWLADRRGSSVG